MSAVKRVVLIITSLLLVDDCNIGDLNQYYSRPSSSSVVRIAWAKRGPFTSCVVCMPAGSKAAVGSVPAYRSPPSSSILYCTHQQLEFLSMPYPYLYLVVTGRITLIAQILAAQAAYFKSQNSANTRFTNCRSGLLWQRQAPRLRRPGLLRE
jgi:hypothetical protein